MEATVQYNDFKGTAAADISDHTDLDKFLGSRGVDVENIKLLEQVFITDMPILFMLQ